MSDTRGNSNAGGAEPGLTASKALREIEEPFIGDPLRRRGWLWRGEPIDFFALIIVVLGMQSSIDLIAGGPRDTVLHFVGRTVPFLVIAVIVAILTWFCPESLRSHSDRRR